MSLGALRRPPQSVVRDPDAADRLHHKVPVISRKELASMFANIRKQTPWNIDGDMLWGYFFHHSTAGPLRLASHELEASGYRSVGIFVPDAGGYTLHVERVESHTVESLHARNSDLEALAARLGIDSYDGMDVGRVVT